MYRIFSVEIKHSKLLFVLNFPFFKFSAGLGEFKLRDVNDEINKLLREKGHWEDQILTLGGPDYRVGLGIPNIFIAAYINNLLGLF